VQPHCYNLSPFHDTGGGDTAPAFSGRHVYLQFTWEVGLPPLLWSFPPTTTFISFPAPGCWVGAAATPAFSGQLVYLQFREGFLPHLSALRAPCPLCYMSFFFSFQLLVYYSVWFFSLGGSRSVQGATLIWPRFVCGSITCHLAHLVVCFSRAG
jgi:hypothetical protein